MQHILPPLFHLAGGISPAQIHPLFLSYFITLGNPMKKELNTCKEQKDIELDSFGRLLKIREGSYEIESFLVISGLNAYKCGMGC